MAANVKGVHHISLKAKGSAEYAKLFSFYHEVLELPVVRCWGEGENLGAMLDTGAGFMEITSNAEDFLGQGAIRHFALDVADTEACVEAVRKAGYEITMEPKDIVINSNPPYPAKIAFCIGPVGEEIEFFQVK